MPRCVYSSPFFLVTVVLSTYILLVIWKWTMGALYRFQFFCQGVCYAIALGAFCRFFRLRFALSLYYKRTYANFVQKKMAMLGSSGKASNGQMVLIGFDDAKRCRRCRWCRHYPIYAVLLDTFKAVSWLITRISVDTPFDSDRIQPPGGGSLPPIVLTVHCPKASNSNS